LPLVEESLLIGKRRLIAWHPQAKISHIPPEIVSRYDPSGLAFWNVNTPAEFHQAETKARWIEQNPN
jgi:hypothetical protein